jgi:hypothetical protein
MMFSLRHPKPQTDKPSFLSGVCSYRRLGGAFRLDVSEELFDVIVAPLAAAQPFCSRHD